ncbi:Riboflavin synthase eubacterial/eukaryotic [hydrothermal vent metagenome]|uniref:Riboflavin synthase n=1 Tax=hydrothermal vent metagenome TaxID=652676 RepID=A0A3B0YMF5_9ZZZZ
MFTGIIQSIGEVAALQPKSDDLRLHIRTGKLELNDVAIGDSIATSGVCLTVVDLPGDGFWADVSGETLACTRTGDLKTGDRVNLEKALTPSTPLGGHLVSGHVDGLGEVVSRQEDGRSIRFRMRAPDNLAHYIAAKGSVCVDGVSLTVNAVDGAEFELNIVPHTLVETTMGEYQPGRTFNLEVDLIARYLERLLLGDRAAQPSSEGITKELLERCGFMSAADR